MATFLARQGQGTLFYRKLRLGGSEVESGFSDSRPENVGRFTPSLRCDPAIVPKCRFAVTVAGPAEPTSVGFQAQKGALLLWPSMAAVSVWPLHLPYEAAE